jgi:ribonucleoside-diphosphate reductase alpha chain
MQNTKTLYKGKNGEAKKEEKISLDEVEVSTYEVIVSEIQGKIGKMPKRPSDLQKGSWTKQARKVLSERYLQKNKEGEIIETPEDMVWRVSWEIASAEARWGKTRDEVLNIAKDFYRLLTSRRFLPNSPTLMNAGTGNQLQYSACFVLPVEDSMEGIFDALKWQALIHKSGGGTGFAFSRLRPSGSMVKTSSGTASGPVSFMRIFDAATNEVKQGGKRRGANMGILRVDHPDIMDFIHCKEDGGITNFNISVGITDKFMEAYEKEGDYDLVDPKTKEVVGSLNAKEVFDEIADGAWRTGDPGVIFLDRINDSTANPVPLLGPIESTNPCGEQPLYPFDACNLGSIFLTYFVKEENGEKVIDWERLKKVTRQATRFLDNVIEVNPYPLKEIRQTVFASRRIGLGVGGWADMLIDLEIPYDSQEALDLGEEVMRTIQEESVRTTQKLAEMRGPFPLWPVSIYKNDIPRRNSTVTTIAPTGTISIIAGTSSGIEPLFAVSYQHIVKDKHLSRTLTFVNPKFKEIAKEKGFWSEELKDKIAEDGLVRNVDEVPKEVRAVFGTAHDIHHDWHIQMQSAFQTYTENAVSKTINLKHTADIKDIKNAYLLAWKTDCKGITVFRDGSKDAQVLNLGVNGKKKETEEVKEALEEPKAERPYIVKGATYRVNTPVGTAFVTINERENGEPLEVFINVGKAGSDVTAMAEALGRTISTALRFRGTLSPKDRAREVASQLAGIGGRRSVGFGPNKILSLPDAVAMALSNHFDFKTNGNGQASVVKEEKNEEVKSNGEKKVEAKSDLAGAVMVAAHPSHEGNHDPTMASAESDVSSTSAQVFAPSPGVHADICPSCGASALVYEEGCAKCHACGHSEC